MALLSKPSISSYKAFLAIATSLQACSNPKNLALWLTSLQRIAIQRHLYVGCGSSLDREATSLLGFQPRMNSTVKRLENWCILILIAIPTPSMANT